MRKNFVAYRNNLTKQIIKAKEDYYRRKLIEFKNDPKKIWKLMNEVTRRFKNKFTKIQRIKAEGMYYTSNIDMANHFNNLFTTIELKMAENIKLRPQVDGENYYTLVDKSEKKLYDLNPASENEVIELIASLKPNSSPGLDGIPTTLIKTYHKYLVKPIVSIINKIYKTGIVPRAFKHSIIIPVHKNNEKDLLTNYRPISLISNIAKIFEKSLKVRLVNFIESNNILSSEQYGFRQGKGTEDAIYKFTTEITEALDNNKKVTSVFLDLAKAFDTVPHDRLLEKMYRIGFRGKVLEVLSSYIKNRKQTVKLQSELSKPTYVLIGTPQGTVLGPILFLLYINDMLELKLNGKILVSIA